MGKESFGGRGNSNVAFWPYPSNLLRFLPKFKGEGCQNPVFFGFKIVVNNEIIETLRTRQFNQNLASRGPVIGVDCSLILPSA